MKKRSGLYIFTVIILVAILLVPFMAQAATIDGYTVVLLHMNGVNGSTTFVDDAGNTWMANGDAQIDTSQSVFGNASGRFAGGSDWITTPDSNSYDFGSGDGTIDFWVRFNSLPTEGNLVWFVGQFYGESNWSFDLYNNSGTYQLRYVTASPYVVDWSPSLNVWYTLAAVKSGGNRYIFVDGNQLGSTGTGYSDPLNISGDLSIGGQPSLGRVFDGWLDEFRLSKGIARWTSNYVPETPTATPTITNTPTDTSIFTDTATPTLTLTPTLTPTITASPTSTVTPMASIAWAPATFSISTALQNALASELIAFPPSDSSGNVYGMISAQTDGSGGWFISLVNVVGISSPYTGWSALANGQWSGGLDCSGTEPIWTCTYYNPTPAIGGTGGLVFPWQSGTYSIYGQEGIHHDVNCPGGCALPGDDAVDFVSGDALGISAMPPYAYAAEAGTVTWSCQGAHNGGLIISGASGKLMYFHLAPNQAAFTIGSSFQQGQEIGRLAYGTFDDSPCGYASQGATDYHLHFAWYPSGNTFSIGGCILDLTTQNWLCGTTTIGILGHLNNSGGTSPAPTASGPTITPGGPTVTPVPGVIGPSIGGEHVWNGIIQAVIDFIHANANAILPQHTSSTTLSDAVNNSWSTIMDFGWMIQSLQMIWVLPALIVWGIMLTVEIVRWIYVGYRTIVRLLPMP